jgi:hypothetical protein
MNENKPFAEFETAFQSTPPYMRPFSLPVTSPIAVLIRVIPVPHERRLRHGVVNVARVCIEGGPLDAVGVVGAHTLEVDDVGDLAVAAA